MSGIDKQSRVVELIAKLIGQLDEGTRLTVLIRGSNRGSRGDDFERGNRYTTVADRSESFSSNGFGGDVELYPIRS